MPIKETLEKLQEQAKARAKPEPVRYGTMATGDCHRQGDVYFVCLAVLPEGCKKTEARAQLAPGDTQGSRHIIRKPDMAALRFHVKSQPTPLDGPVILAGAEWTVDHPEHGSVTLPAGIYGVTYQRQYAEELRRVAD